MKKSYVITGISALILVVLFGPVGLVLAVVGYLFWLKWINTPKK